MPHADTIRRTVALVFLACSLSVVVWHLAADLAPASEANDLSFRRAPSSAETYLRLRQEWRPRVGSALSARLACGLYDHLPPRDQLRRAVGLHSAAWLLATNLVLIVGFRRQALPLMWGVSAAVAFGYAPGLVSRVYPWDLPAMFFFALFLAALDRDRWPLVAAAIGVGLLFKETTAVLCLAPLFRTGVPRRRRLIHTAALAGAVVVLKLAVDLAVKNPIPLLSATTSAPDGRQLRLLDNLRLLGSSLGAHPVWINAGTLVALVLVPGRVRHVPLTRTVALCFAGSLLVFGVITEFRIWFELAPLCVLALVRWLQDGGVAPRLQG